MLLQRLDPLASFLFFFFFNVDEVEDVETSDFRNADGDGMLLVAAVVVVDDRIIEAYTGGAGGCGGGILDVDSIDSICCASSSVGSRKMISS